MNALLQAIACDSWERGLAAELLPLAPMVGDIQGAPREGGRNFGRGRDDSR